VSIRKLCEWFDVPRSLIYREPRLRKRNRFNEGLTTEIRAIIDEQPFMDFGVSTSSLIEDEHRKVNI
jgi:hypothetical protein